MKRSLVTAGAGLVLALASTGGPSAAAPPAASAAPPATSAAPPASPPVVHGSDIPAVASPAPTTVEWRAGKRVLPTRGGGGDCEFVLVREWLRVHCRRELGAGVVAGDTKGVSVRVVGRLFGPTGDPGDLAATVVLPIKRGQARVIAFNDPIEEYDSTALGEGPTLGIVWREGRADPVLTLYGRPKRD